MEADGGVWDDFGQKVDLTARLREILINYPEGTSILKELVQNAVRGELCCCFSLEPSERDALASRGDGRAIRRPSSQQPPPERSP
jgi:hypothetical protein